jgi:hypothetical protein
LVAVWSDIREANIWLREVKAYRRWWNLLKENVNSNAKIELLKKDVDSELKRMLKVVEQIEKQDGVIESLQREIVRLESMIETSAINKQTSSLPELREKEKEEEPPKYDGWYLKYTEHNEKMFFVHLQENETLKESNIEDCNKFSSGKWMKINGGIELLVGLRKTTLQVDSRDKFGYNFEGEEFGMKAFLRPCPSKYNGFYGLGFTPKLYIKRIGSEIFFLFLKKDGSLVEYNAVSEREVCSNGIWVKQDERTLILKMGRRQSSLTVPINKNLRYRFFGVEEQVKSNSAPIGVWLYDVPRKLYS